MFTDAHKALAMNFTQLLLDRKYEDAYDLCSDHYRSRFTLDQMKDEFEWMIPLDWGQFWTEMVEVEDDQTFIYVSIGGDVYSEAVIIDSFVTEGGQLKIDEFQFGRP